MIIAVIAVLIVVGYIVLVRQSCSAKVDTYLSKIGASEDAVQRRILIAYEKGMLDSILEESDYAGIAREEIYDMIRRYRDAI